MKRILAFAAISVACLGASFYAGRATAPIGIIQLADHGMLDNVSIVGPIRIIGDGVSNTTIRHVIISP